MTGPMLALVELAAAGLTPLRRVLATAARPGLRLWRLAGLRAATTGTIPVTTQFDGPVRTLPGSRVTLGEHCRLGHAMYFETRAEGRISLGSHVRVNTGTLIVSHASVTIGDDCLIGEYVSIRDADHGMATLEPMRLQAHGAEPITIGRDVWIARGAAILKGVKIGDGAVVAANSVVTRDVPAMAVVAGAPARVVRFRGPDESRSGAPPAAAR